LPFSKTVGGNGPARWPIDAHQHICQACHRTRDQYPAGIVTIRGRFAMCYRAEILGMARRLEQHEKFLHPLHRIMGVEQRRNSIVIKTTDIDLPQVIREALRHTYGGNLEINSQVERYSVQVNWRCMEEKQRDSDTPTDAFG
jgi:hypothetical protein